MAALSIVIVTWNSVDTILPCIASLPPGAEILVVDNGSTDGTRTLLADLGRHIQVIDPGCNLGFGTACNLAVQQASGDRLLFLNPDASLLPGSLEKLGEVLDRHPDCGAVGPRIIASDDTLELSWGDDPDFLSEWRRRGEHHGKILLHPDELTSVDWVSGACMLVRRSAWQAIQGFDPGFFLYFEDLDLCRRLRMQGWNVMFEPLARVNHQRNHSAKQIPSQVEVWYRASQLRYYTKHNAPLQQGALRAYLAMKYFWRALRGARSAQHVIGLAFRGA